MKNIFLLVFLSLGLNFVSAQLNTPNHTPEKRWRLGAGAGLSFGNNGYFDMSLSPSVGYNLGNGAELGATVGYQLNKNNYYTINLFSGGPYLNYTFMPQLFGRVHYEYYTGSRKFKPSDYKDNIDESALWVGGGYESRGPIRFRAGIMYNVLYKENSIFSSAIRPFAGVVVAM